MKKTIFILVILSLLLSVCSCATSNSKEIESLNQKISELEKQGESTTADKIENTNNNQGIIKVKITVNRPWVPIWNEKGLATAVVNEKGDPITWGGIRELKVDGITVDQNNYRVNYDPDSAILDGVIIIGECDKFSYGIHTITIKYSDYDGVRGQGGFDIGLYSTQRSNSDPDWSLDESAPVIFETSVDLESDEVLFTGEVSGAAADKVSY